MLKWPLGWGWLTPYRIPCRVRFRPPKLTLLTRSAQAVNQVLPVQVDNATAGADIHHDPFESRRCGPFIKVQHRPAWFFTKWHDAPKSERYLPQYRTKKGPVKGPLNRELKKIGKVADNGHNMLHNQHTTNNRNHRYGFHVYLLLCRIILLTAVAVKPQFLPGHIFPGFQGILRGEAYSGKCAHGPGPVSTATAERKT